LGGSGTLGASYLSMCAEISSSRSAFGLSSKLTSFDAPKVLLIDRQGAK